MSYIFVDTVEQYEVFQKALKEYDGIIGADTETTGLNWWEHKILLLQASLGDTIYIMDVRKLGGNFLRDAISIIAGKKNRVLFHNAKFDLKFIYHKTKIWLENIYDTMIGEVILNAGKGKTLYSLSDLTEKYTDYLMEKESRSEFIDFPDDKPFTEHMLAYSALDVKVLPEIYAKQLGEFVSTKQTKILDLDMDLIPVVARMEYTGIRLNKEAWLKLDKIARAKLEELLSKIKPEIADRAIKRAKVTNGLELAKALKISEGTKTKRDQKALEEITDLSLMKGWIERNLNLGSWQQKVAILNLYGVKVTSSNEKVIQKYADKFPIVNKLLEISGVEKQISQYGESFLKDLNPITGKIHTDYFTVGTQTGRFSSSRPNLQNVPTDGGYRECFIPSPGYVFISCDYSQQEYRLCGAVSREPIIIDAYLKGYDMHIATAANIMKKALADVTKDERKWGKTRNFEIIYGTTEWGLSKSLKCSPEAAKKFLDGYWEGYPVLSKFKELSEGKIMELGYSRTPMGRRRYNPEKPMFMGVNQLLSWEARVKREGFNHIIQGGGADIIKIAMVNLHRKNPFGDAFRILLQIHDELLFEVQESIAEQAGEFIKREMIAAEQFFLKEIPAVVEGYNVIKHEWSK